MTFNCTYVMKTSRVSSNPCFSSKSSRRCKLEIRLFDVFKDVAHEEILRLMPKGPHFLEMLLFEVREETFHQLPEQGIDEGKVVHDRFKQCYENLPVAFLLRYAAGLGETRGRSRQ